VEKACETQCHHSPSYLVLGLPHDPTLVDGPLASSSANTGPEDDKSLLGFVAQETCLVRAGGAVRPYHTGQLSITTNKGTTHSMKYIIIMKESTTITQQ
jgi:hypothetical protein